ncbi:MAG: hypothetical protein J2P38_04615 [Candidatus Dormibacteraeota bacterium]|nr:hypothetical protein [Candidatus Dormibacteraeota bacterium]
MSQQSLYRTAAIALVLGAVIVTLGNLLAPQGDARSAVASGLYYPMGVAVLVGGLLVMGAWPAVYLRQRLETGLLGLAGFVLVLAAGMALTVGFPLLQLLTYPWIATLAVSNRTLDAGPVVFTVFFAVTSGVVTLGGILFGAASLRAGVFSRALSVVFIVLVVASAVLGFLSLPGGGGIQMSWWWGTTGTFGVVAYMIGLCWFGIELFRAPTPRAGVVGTAEADPRLTG